MKEYVKNFFLRGMMFGGFGPIIAGIVYLSLSFSIDNFTLSGKEVFLAIISVYMLAFIQAGASVFNQIESWSYAKSGLIHFSVLYVSYVSCYLVNTWIPFDWMVIGVFSIIFLAMYLIIWLSVYIGVKITSKNLNKKL